MSLGAGAGLLDGGRERRQVLAHLFDELRRRGEANGISLQEISEHEAKEIEPRVKTFERALFSPTTSTVDPRRVLSAMKTDAIKEGVVVEAGVRYIRRSGSALITSTGSYQAGYVVNAAGLYADRIARDFGFSDRYRILPFKGLYLYANEEAAALRTNVYPVPDLGNPFLGVHFTVTVDGHAKIGPTASEVAKYVFAKLRFINALIKAGLARSLQSSPDIRGTFITLK